MYHDSHHLLPAKLADLHPTQITVGLAEVVAKRAEWAKLKRKQRAHLLAAHWFPAVKGPGGRFYIVDHHHLGLALQQEEISQVWVMQLDDFSQLKGETFWRLMEFRRWAHPYDQRGQRRDYASIPDAVTALRDDPYRSLAGMVRSAGGFAKDTAPFSEFIWADYFRLHPALRMLAKVKKGEMPPPVLQRAMQLAREPLARHLPGWSGRSDDDVDEQA